jgi:hypothetical protein
LVSHYRWSEHDPLNVIDTDLVATAVIELPRAGCGCLAVKNSEKRIEARSPAAVASAAIGGAPMVTTWFIADTELPSRPKSPGNRQA